jgi:hypothetical protein
MRQQIEEILAEIAACSPVSLNGSMVALSLLTIGLLADAVVNPATPRIGRDARIALVAAIIGLLLNLELWVWATLGGS